MAGRSQARPPGPRKPSGARSRSAPPSAAPAEILALPDLRVPVASLEWWQPLGGTLRLPPGGAAPAVLRVPADEATRILRATVRLVADVRAGAPGTVVWTQGDSELLVRLDGVQLACAPGLATVTLVVSCDQLPEPVSVAVPFAVGSAQRTSGLVSSTFDRVTGPAVVAVVWSEALIAFAWEALVHLAQQLSGGVGEDASGRALVPASIGAEQDVLLVHPMARHTLGPLAL